MNRLVLILTLTISVLLGSSGVCWSADFQKGLDAANRGDFATAFKQAVSALGSSKDILFQWNGSVYTTAIE